MLLKPFKARFQACEELEAFGSDKVSGKGLRSGASCLEVLEKRSVLVAVRARPLNDREKSAASQECLTFQERLRSLLKCLELSSLHALGDLKTLKGSGGLFESHARTRRASRCSGRMIVNNASPLIA